MSRNSYSFHRFNVQNFGQNKLLAWSLKGRMTNQRRCVEDVETIQLFVLLLQAYIFLSDYPNQLVEASNTSLNILQRMS